MRWLLAFACVVGLAGAVHATPCAESIGPGSIDASKRVWSADHTMPGLTIDRIVVHPGALELVGAWFSPEITRVHIEYGRPRVDVWTTPDRTVVCAPGADGPMVVLVTGFTNAGVRSSTLAGSAYPEGYAPPPYSARPPVHPLLAILTAVGMLLTIAVLVVYAVVPPRRKRVRVPRARARLVSRG